MIEFLECVMLICFGFSWPISAIKSMKAKTAESTSLNFIILIIIGYVAGISAKIASNNFGITLYVYLINLAAVSINLLIFFRNKKLDRNRKSA